MKFVLHLLLPTRQKKGTVFEVNRPSHSSFQVRESFKYHTNVTSEHEKKTISWEKIGPIYQGQGLKE